MRETVVEIEKGKLLVQFKKQFYERTAMSDLDLLQYVDHTLLKAVAAWDDIKILCDERPTSAVSFRSLRSKRNKKAAPIALGRPYPFVLSLIIVEKFSNQLWHSSHLL